MCGYDRAIPSDRPCSHRIEQLKDHQLRTASLNSLACNAPIQQLYNLGVEIEENSELDLFEAFNKHAGDERIPAVVKEMEEELGAGIENRRSSQNWRSTN